MFIIVRARISGGLVVEIGQKGGYLMKKGGYWSSKGPGMQGNHQFYDFPKKVGTMVPDCGKRKYYYRWDWKKEDVKMKNCNLRGKNVNGKKRRFGYPQNTVSSVVWLPKIHMKVMEKEKELSS